MKYGEDTIPVCPDCAMLVDATKHCEKCAVEFCVHYASKIDARACGNCLEDVTVIEEIVYKTTIYENAEGEEITRKRQIAKSLKLTGTDWMFANRQISMLSDEELIESIEYHRNIASVMLLEKEERRTEQLNKLAKVKINIRKPATLDGAKPTKAPKTEAEKQQAAIAKALAGLTPEQLMAVLQKAMGAK